jgi:hypothetical protein
MTFEAFTLSASFLLKVKEIGISKSEFRAKTSPLRKGNVVLPE